VNTKQLANQLDIRPESIHARFCRTGSYFSLVPDKMPNGQLFWPDDSIEQLKEIARKHHGVSDRTEKARSVLAAKRAAAAQSSCGVA
jgi:hypothetical protein